MVEKTGDDATDAGKREEAAIAYVAALSLGSSDPSAVLGKWAIVALTDCSALEVLQTTVKVYLSRLIGHGY